MGLGLALLSPGVARANDFPTQARVEFVLGCMNDQGGQNYDALYKCVCLVDAIAAEMSHDEFAEAQVFSQLRSTPGERGGVFRDPDQARSLVAKLQAVIERGKAKCLIRSK
jgi:aminopeptidase-like protein